MPCLRASSVNAASAYRHRHVSYVTTTDSQRDSTARREHEQGLDELFEARGVQTCQ